MIFEMRKWQKKKKKKKRIRSPSSTVILRSKEAAGKKSYDRSIRIFQEQVIVATGEEIQITASYSVMDNLFCK